MSRIKLKKSEYPSKIGCLITNCLTMSDKARYQGGYKNCPNLTWKTENREKYDIKLDRYGNIKSVYEIKE